MNESHRERFAAAMEKLCIVHERRVDGDSFDGLLRAYWEALNRMDIDVFERAIARSIEDSDRFPKPSTLWGITKTLRNEGRALNDGPGPAPNGDSLYGFANIVMRNWLWRHVLTHRRPPLSQPKLDEVIEAKNRQLQFFRELVGDRDPEANAGYFIDHFEREANKIAGVA